MRPYYELTYRGRALRLRRMAFAALASYDLQVGRVRLLSNDLNGIFRVDTTAGEKYVLRVCLPGTAGHTLEEIRSEMMWLEALNNDANLNTPRPVTTRDGRYVTTVEVDGVPEPRHCVVFTWAPGKDLADRLSPNNVFMMGELAAGIHSQAESFEPPEGFWIRSKYKVFPYSEEVIIFDAEQEPLFPPERRRVYQQAVDRIQAALDHLCSRGEPPRVIHNDLHQWNVKAYHSRLFAIDFEDLMWGHPVQDLAVTLYYLVGYDNYPQLRDTFRHGYTMHRDWPEAYEGEIDIFIAGRGLTLANFVLQDPDVKYRAMAPEYVERIEGRLMTLLKL